MQNPMIQQVFFVALPLPLPAGGESGGGEEQWGGGAVGGRVEVEGELT